MPLESYRGPNLSILMARASSEIGADAVVISVQKVTDYHGRPEFELLAADPWTAQEQSQGSIHSGFPFESVSMAPSSPVGRPLVIAIVGPTGSGKTTTIAKLANHPDIFGPRLVGFLCLDTYRVGAMEQLKIFAALSRVAVETVFEAKDIPRAMRKLRECEVILIDTPGRGPSLSIDAEAAHSLLRLLHPDEVHMTLPAGLREPVARSMFDQHRACGLTHIMPTKLDECPEDSTAYDLATEFELPMRWAADGQEIPEGIRSARSSEGAESGIELRHEERSQKASVPTARMRDSRASLPASASPPPVPIQTPPYEPRRVALPGPAHRTLYGPTHASGPGLTRQSSPGPARAWTWDDVIRHKVGAGRR